MWNYEDLFRKGSTKAQKATNKLKRKSKNKQQKASRKINRK